MKTIKGIILSLIASFTVTLSGQEKNSFYDVTKHLDKGGDFYLYMNTIDAAKALNNQIEVLHETITAMPDMEPENKKKVDKGFAMFSKLLKESGMLEISGLGVSAKKENTGLYKNTIFIHHFPGSGKGKLWSAFGNSAHEMNELSLLPDDTVIATYNDIEAGKTWSWITNAIKTSGIEELEKGFKEFNSKSLQNGFDIQELLNSVNGGSGMLITMDKENKITIPVNGNKGQEIPEPGIMIFIKVKDEKIFNLIQYKTMEGNDPKRHLAKRADSKGRKALVFVMGIPYLPGPAVAVQSDGYLMIASSMKLVDKVLAVKNKNKQGLTSTSEFKKLSKGIPLKGNGFQFVSSRTQSLITDFQKKILKSDKSMNPEQSELLQKMFFNNNENFALLSINSVEKEGLFFRSKSTSNAATIMFTQATIAPVGIMAAMLLPALSMARESARKISCTNNLKQLGLSMRMYSNVFDEKYPNIDGAAGLDLLRSEGFLENPAVYVCPSTSDKKAKPGEKLTEDTVSYVYFGGFTEADSVDIPLAFDKIGNHEKYVNILFVDGHVKGYAGSFNKCSDVVEMLISGSRYSQKDQKILREKAKRADLLLNK